MKNLTSDYPQEQTSYNTNQKVQVLHVDYNHFSIESAGHYSNNSAQLHSEVAFRYTSFKEAMDKISKNQNGEK